jgi:hypothetical protein
MRADLRLSVLAVLLSLTVNGATTGGCGAKPEESISKSTGAAAASPERGREMDSGMEREVITLAQGNYPASDGFVALARDPETYAALKAMANLEQKFDAAFFRDRAVVGVFLGQRRTSGYSVEVTLAPDGGVRIAESSPPPGTPVKMVLSAPYRIVSVPVDDKRPLKIVFDETWRASGRPYRLKAGEVRVAGESFAVSERLRVEGDVRVMREKELATFVFDLEGSSGTTKRAAKSVATGIAQTGGRVHLSQVDLGPLTGSQYLPLQATVDFTVEGNSFSLTSTSPRAADGRKVEVALEGVAQAASTPD